MPLTTKGKKKKRSMVKKLVKGVSKGSKDYMKSREAAINKILTKGKY